jgi:hypothetical protein
MPLPWLQIVQLVPSILDVSRELLRKTRRLPELPTEAGNSDENLLVRIASLEENERRQAELINQMAEQIAGLARAVTVLHRRVLWLTAGLGIAIVVAVIVKVT